MDNLKDLCNNYLTPADWAELEVIHKFLRPFEQATRSCEGNNVTLNQTLYIVDFLINHLNQSEDAHRRRSGRHASSEFLVCTRVA